MSVSMSFSTLWSAIFALLRKKSQYSAAIGVLVLCAAMTSTPAWAQATSAGTIVGVVTDPSGAVITNATVTIRDTSTNQTRTTKTNQTGSYVFVNVVPGTYDIKATQTGFAEAKVLAQVVLVGSQLTVNIPMQVGASTQEIVVSVTGTELQTLNSTVGNTVSGSTLQSLPTLGRDVSSFVTLQPAVSPDGSAAGTVVDQSVFMLDGGNNSNDMDGSGGVYNPSFAAYDDPAGGLFYNSNNSVTGIIAGIAGNQPSGVMPTPIDSVEEFKVATTNQTADFNNSSGMEVQIVTKRGTNAWHGTVYEYYLDNTMSGNTWQNKQSGTAVPDWHRNWFGAAVGGPIIPKDILGGKTYIFLLYQGSRWPLSQTIDRLVPSADMREGILTDPSSMATYNLNTLDPRGIGLNSYVKQLWSKYMPLPTPGAGCGPFTGDGFCDGVNTLDFRSNVLIPQNDNQGVVRVDHDFSPKWHFMSSFRYYNLVRATTDQVDIGGFFSGDTLGTPSSLTTRPQLPWFLVLGMTTNVSSHVTNDFRYSFLRNWWQWGSRGDPAQFSNLGAALEPFGEQQTEVLAPYNVNTQQTRTRFWDGHDNFLRDDVSMLKGSHLLQFGGQYQHNWNYHQRTDNGGGINYYPVYLLGDTGGAPNVDMTALGAAFSSSTLAREAAAVLGIVTDTQQVYTRTGNNLMLNPALTPAFDQSTIPYYNIYFNDTWKMKTNLTLTYGLGWSLEMPPVEANGKQVIFVNSQDQPIVASQYLAARQAAALTGQVYNPEIGFALIDNVAGHPKYPFNPFYGGVSPRVAIAWNPDLGQKFGGKNTVFRGGYGRIYGRVNGVALVLTPLLSPGLLQAVNCTTVAANNPSVPGSGGFCGIPAAGLTVANAFRIGTDGTTAPIPAASATLPQPFYPGINGNAEAATAAPIDPHFRPDSVDSFDFTIQHQITNKLSVEVGAISRLIHNEIQNINVNAVPYMMTIGGEQFQTAYANIEKQLGCATSVSACGANVPTTPAALKTYANTFAPQQFFEKALGPTGYCAGFASCTAAVVYNQASNLTTQSVWSLWSALDTNFPVTGVPGFNFPYSMMNTAGQMSSNVTMLTSLGHGNYNAGFVTFKMNDWHGVTAQNNLTWSKALGTGGVVQATSEETAVDPYDLNRQYGPQAYDRKFVDTMFMAYQPPYYRSQQGLIGHLLGGWTFSPIFSAGSGAPLFCNTNTGGFSNGYSGSQDWGSGDSLNVFTNANCVFNSKAGTSASVHYLSNGTANMFANPQLVFQNVRPLILGLDSSSGAFGQLRGLPYWNVNFGIKKDIRVTERFSTVASVNFTNVFNHNQLLDPVLSIAGSNGLTTAPSSFGQVTTEGTLPRTMEFGIRANF